MAAEHMRSVARTLIIMQAMQRLGAASLAGLHADCQLSKPVLLRILHTLELHGFVWRAAGDGLWRPAFELRPHSTIKPAHQRLIDAALPVLETLRQQVIWPSDLAVRDGDSMRLLETTRRTSGLSVNRDRIGHRIDMLRSAVGKAWLSAANPTVVEMMSRVLAKRNAEDVSTMRIRLADCREHVQARGYAERDPAFGGRDEPIDVFNDQLAAIATPIRGGREGALGAINIVWLKRFDAKAALVERHRADLLQAAASIADRWKHLTESARNPAVDRTGSICAASGSTARTAEPLWSKRRSAGRK